MNQNIIIRLAGGMGNQLFQYAAALKLRTSAAKESLISIDTTCLSTYESKRIFQIGFITKHHKKINIMNNLNSFSVIMSRLRLPRILDQRVGSFEFISSVYHLKRSCTSSPARLYILDGYFQDPSLLFDEKDRINLRDSLLREVGKKIKSFSEGIPLLAVHIRRGDYVSSHDASKVFNIVPLSYYREALNLLTKKYKILIFSDDSILSSQFAMEVGGIDVNTLGLGLTDQFCLYMSCEDYIISNSTFSWWASYLGRRSNSVIVAPYNWYRDPIMSRNNKLILPYFLTIP